jgi:hypothetical protein
MIAHRRPALILAMAGLLVAGSSAWLIAASDDIDAESADSTTSDTVIVYEDPDDEDGVVISGEIAREIHRALEEAMAGVDEAMGAVRGLSVRVEPLERGRGRVRIRVDDDGDVSEAIVDPIEIQRQVDRALQQVDFERLGADLERSMDQLGDELGRMGEEMGRAFEDGHWKRVRRATAASADDVQLNAEVRRLKSEIRALEREIRRLQAGRGDAGVRGFD